MTDEYLKGITEREPNSRASRKHYQHHQFIIVDKFNRPLNHHFIATNPTSSIRCFHRRDQAEKELARLIPISKYYRSCEIITAYVSFEAVEPEAPIA